MIAVPWGLIPLITDYTPSIWQCIIIRTSEKRVKERSGWALGSGIKGEMIGIGASSFKHREAWRIWQNICLSVIQSYIPCCHLSACLMSTFVLWGSLAFGSVSEIESWWDSLTLKQQERKEKRDFWAKIQPVVFLKLVFTLLQGLSVNGLLPKEKWGKRECNWHVDRKAEV